MPEFSLNKIEAAAGKVNFYELVVDGVRPFKEFRDEIRDNPSLMTELKRVFSTISMLSDGRHVPGNLCHALKNPVAGGVEYEIITTELRVYFFKHVDGKVIVLPGYKVDQKLDIPKFRNLKTQFINSL